MMDCVGDYTKCGVDKRSCIKGVDVCAEKRQQIADDNKRRKEGWEQLKKLKETQNQSWNQ